MMKQTQFDRVITIEDNKSFTWENRDWGVEHLAVIKSESMEMHHKKVLPHSVGIPHKHHYETLYYVLSGEIISISGENLEHVSIQKAGSYVHVPNGVLHTVANLGDESAITLVVHNIHNVEDKCTTYFEKEDVAKSVIAKLANDTFVK